jgi:TonB family protein
MPKIVPMASDEDALMTAAPTRVAQATGLRRQTNSIHAPKLVGRTRGVGSSHVHFKVSDRGSLAAGAAAIAIPIGEEQGDTALVGTSAPRLIDAPKGRRHIGGNSMGAPIGNGVGVLAGKARTGYVGAIQVGEPSMQEVLAVANSAGTAGGKGVEIGGPVGDRKILKRALPEYPSWAEEKGISAMVKIYFTVKPDGRIRRSVRILQSSGYAELDSLAKDALLAWKFSPTDATSDSEAWGVITFRFTLA